jgi:hypothetical protein
VSSGLFHFAVSEVLVASTITTLMMKAANTPEMSVNFHQTTWHNLSKDSHFHTHCCGCPKSHLALKVVLVSLLDTKLINLITVFRIVTNNKQLCQSRPSITLRSYQLNGASVPCTRSGALIKYVWSTFSKQNKSSPHTFMINMPTVIIVRKKPRLE